MKWQRKMPCEFSVWGLVDGALPNVLYFIMSGQVVADGLNQKRI